MLETICIEQYITAPLLRWEESWSSARNRQ